VASLLARQARTRPSPELARHQQAGAGTVPAGPPVHVDESSLVLAWRGRFFANAAN